MQHRSTLWALVLSLAALAAFAAVPPNLNKALETQHRLAAERPDDAGVFNDLGNLLVIAEQPEEAVEAYERALELDPARLATHFNLGLVLQQLGQSRKALQQFREVLELEPRHAWAYYQIGAVNESTGRDSEAIEAYARAFALDPQLAFTEVNPAVIDSRLVTEALLRAHRKEEAQPLAPLVYNEPGRIAALLVPPVPTTPREGETATAEAGAADERTGAAGPGAMGQQPGAAGAAPGAEAAPGMRSGPPTVLRESDLSGGGAVNQASPQGRGGRTSSSTRQVPRSFSRPSDPTGGRVLTPQQPGDVPAPPGRVIYRPGLPSTGRLDIKVLPDTGTAGAIS